MATNIVTIEKTMTAAIMVEQVVCLVMRVFQALGITDVGGGAYVGARQWPSIRPLQKWRWNCAAPEKLRRWAGLS